ncbi:sugar transferase [Microbacterium sp. NPDC076911]|uniref:sugar transferase n=1 Tax=Microbacterium sp. NPDC076911 TaxID=3154958 RepID=UPI003448DB4B
MTSNLDIDATPTSLSTDKLSSGAVDRATTAATVRSAAASTRDWRKRYALRLYVSDLLVLVWVVFGTQIAWFGMGNADLAMRHDVRITELSYWIVSAVLVLLWHGALRFTDSRDYRVIGAGSAEYVRVATGSFRLFGFLAIFAFLFQVDIARGYLLIALPVGVLVLILERWLWRQWLIAHRSMGDYSARVLLVGSESSVALISSELSRNVSAGYQVVGACVPSGKVADTIAGTDIPIMGNVDAIERAMVATNADTVAVTSTDDLPPRKVKEISWGLEGGKQHLVLAPSIIDIAGPRIHIRPVSGLPLMHVETPRFSGGQRFLKRAVDVIATVVGVVIISPVLLVLALLVRLSGSGPILFRQKRVGLRGKEFTMLKFRSMVVNAEAMLGDLQVDRDAGNEVLFKIRNDPRVTPIGRFMRRYSLDELPQLFNVIGGSMSLVGPRPPLSSEVAMYADHVHRRFLVKPGVTGAWQVGGRSSLSWDESVRLDLSYVENWSLLGDVAIMTKTVGAVLRPGHTSA